MDESGLSIGRVKAFVFFGFTAINVSSALVAVTVLPSGAFDLQTYLSHKDITPPFQSAIYISPYPEYISIKTPQRSSWTGPVEWPFCFALVVAMRILHCDGDS